MGYEFQLTSDGLDVISTLYSFKKQRPTLQIDWYAELSVHSPVVVVNRNFKVRLVGPHRAKLSI
jgi:hypothetical protein